LFEPDYLVETVVGIGAGLGFPTGRVLPLEKILEPGRGAQHAIDVADFYDALYEKEYRFVRRGQGLFVLPRLTEPRLQLLSSAWFGAFPANSAFAYMESAYLQAFDAQRVDVSSATAYEQILNFAGFPLMAGSLELDISGRSYAPDLVLIVVDPNRPADLMDYWNLRALGWRVLPFPIGWEHAAESAIRNLIDRAVRRHPTNHQIEFGTSFVPAQSLAQEEFETVVAPFRSRQARPAYYPRLWDDWGRRTDHVARPVIRAGELEEELVLRETYKSFDLPLPEFARELPGAYADPTPTWATAVTLKSYSPTDIATAFPPDLENIGPLLRSPFGLIGLSREGIIVETTVSRHSELWGFPTGGEVFAAWAKQHGFDYVESGTGRLLRQLIRRLDGVRGAVLVRHVELLEVLNKLAHREWEEERPATEGDARPRTRVRSGTILHDDLCRVLGRILAREDQPPTTSAEREAQRQRRAARIRNYIDSLVKRDVLRVGVLIQCPHCRQRTWYPLDGLKSSLECERCLQHYPFPAGSPRDAPWHYRPAGPFAVETYAQGAYAVLLALRFLLTADRHDASWSTSFELKRGDDKLEVDFGIFLGPDRFRGGETRLLLGEGKSGDCQFDAEDYRRARTLVTAFPGSALVFCTTRLELTPPEKNAITRIARQGRREMRPDRPANPIIVLTRVELESTFPPPMCWQGNPRLTPEIEYSFGMHDDVVVALADATQRLHLDMPSMQAERLELFQKQQAARKGQGSAGPVIAVPSTQGEAATRPASPPTAPTSTDG